MENLYILIDMIIEKEVIQEKKMTELKAIKILLIAATILLLFAATSSADADYSYNLTTEGGTMKADESHTHYSPGGMTNQYSLYINAVNSGNASCNHSFSEGGNELKSATNATYLRRTTGIASCLIGGASLIENIGGSSVTPGAAGTTCYQGAIGFKTDADRLERFSSDGLSRNGSDTYYNISAAVGVGKFTAGLDSEEVTKSDSGTWDLVSKKTTSSRIGVRAGAYNFTAKYHVSRS